jgi:predicted N-acyltransferase
LDLEATEVRFISSMGQIQPAAWNELAGSQPMLQHAFLYALESSGCVVLRTGWQPHHLTLWRQNKLVGAMPLYLKSHSYGEYVFDWSWADAHGQLGLPYYPKLLCAIPFTPVPGLRLLADTPHDRLSLVEHVLAFARETDLSSFHCLFPDENGDAAFKESGLMQRRGYQFHWTNPGYAQFDDFLATLTHDKRKKIRQERRKVADTGIRFEHRTASEIREEDWGFFHRCYVHTYREHHSTPYLNLDFFHRLAEQLPNELLLIVAYLDNVPIASAFNLFDGERLYGRYWGALKFIPGLHFETCYYQGMEFCIDHQLRVFEGGAQGEHKLARGFLPVVTRSWHWLADRRIGQAVNDFLSREGRAVENYLSEMEGPYKQGGHHDPDCPNQRHSP